MKDYEKVNIEMFSRAETVERYQKDKKIRRNEQWIFDNYFIKHAGKALVLGCGAGRTMVPLLEKGLVVDGLDISTGMIEACRQNLTGRGMDARLMQGDASDLSFSDDGAYDYVFFPFHGIDFVYPAAGRELVCKEAARVLQKDGLFIFTTHNLLYWKYLLRFFFWRKKDFYVEEKISYGSEQLITFYSLLPVEIKRLKKYFGLVQYIGDRYAETGKRWRTVTTTLSLFRIKYLFFIAQKI